MEQYILALDQGTSSSRAIVFDRKGLMKQAEKFHRPVICLVDTPGAFCGLEAEERGQGEAIARNLYELSSLKVPVLSIVIGEGGSGGALALAAGDQVWMMENSIYSILSPEGFASILWKDSTRAKEAAEVMKLTAADLKALGIIEQVIPENQPLTRENMADTMEELKNRIEPTTPEPRVELPLAPTPCENTSGIIPNTQVPSVKSS